VAWFSAIQFVLLLQGVALFLWHADGLPVARSASGWPPDRRAVGGRRGGARAARMMEALLVEAAALATATAADGFTQLHQLFKPLAMVLAIAVVALRSRDFPASGALRSAVLGRPAVLAGRRRVPDVPGLLPPRPRDRSWWRTCATSRCSSRACAGCRAARRWPPRWAGRAMYRVPLARRPARGAAAAGGGLCRRDRADGGAGRSGARWCCAMRARWRSPCGACVFMLSDTLLAINRFVMPLPLAQFWVLATYYLAQILIVANVPARDDRGVPAGLDLSAAGRALSAARLAGLVLRALGKPQHAVPQR
jgi:hypothetical protein